VLKTESITKRNSKFNLAIINECLGSQNETPRELKQSPSMCVQAGSRTCRGCSDRAQERSPRRRLSGSYTCLETKTEPAKNIYKPFYIGF
jgi:hypothetical protein